MASQNPGSMKIRTERAIPSDRENERSLFKRGVTDLKRVLVRFIDKTSREIPSKDKNWP
jgi:hypothetical protein